MQRQSHRHGGAGQPRCNFPDAAVGRDGDGGQDGHVRGLQVGGRQFPVRDETQEPRGGDPEDPTPVGREEAPGPGGEGDPGGG